MIFGWHNIQIPEYRSKPETQAGEYPDYLADIVLLDADNIDLAGKRGDALLDAYIFAGDDRMITDVWSAGRRTVENGMHFRHEAISQRYRETMQALRAEM